MAAPMRTSSQEAATGHRTRVADPPSGRTVTTASANISNSGGTTAPNTSSSVQQQQATANFEYDDNEWDIGIGDLIIDLDADIEKTNEGAAGGLNANSTNSGNVTSLNSAAAAAAIMATNAGPAATGKTAAKMAIEHSATVDKGLKMKIKRTKPGTKTSEAKHEIVKSNEQNGNVDGMDTLNSGGKSGSKHQNVSTPVSQANSMTTINNNASGGSNSNTGGSNSKRGSSGHRRDKARDKHSSSEKGPVNTGTNKVTVPTSNNSVQVSSITEVNGIVRVSAPQTGTQRPVFPASTGPGPPQNQTGIGNSNPCPPASPASVTSQSSGSKPEQTKIGSGGSNAVITTVSPSTPVNDDRNSSSPPPKKIKTESKEVNDVCVGTSVGTITEPDCLGPCEPGTSVTLEGIVWHETEGGVLVVNVTWRGKTYVGTLLDCTRHDWAPPRFCDSPTSDLDTRTPKGRETRSSVHSKLRNGGGVKGRRGATNGSGPSTAPSSPTPFVQPRPEPSNKRKSRAGEEEPTLNTTGKKTKVVPPAQQPASAPCGSPPPSPVLLECPEPNCSKKYKHINGLKYHQSHAHGSADDEDTKDITSMSENDESNIEAPSPATPVKSPEKSQDSPLTPQKKDGDIPLILRGSGLLEVSSQPPTPRSTPPSPATPQSIQDMTTSAGSPTIPVVETKPVIKPGVLRYSSNEEFPVGVFAGGNKPQQVSGTSLPNQNALSTVRAVNVSILPDQVTPTQPEPTPQPSTPQNFSNQLPTQVPIQPQTFNQPPTLLIPAQNSQTPTQIPSQPSPHTPQSPKPSTGNLTPFKVKPAAALMPEDKKDRNKLTPNFKQKKSSRKSPAGSPNPPDNQQQPVFGSIEQSGREEVQSPAYSDISDDGAPVVETDMGDKSKTSDKKTEPGQQMPHMPQYGMYPFYGQPPYLVSSVQQQQAQQQQQQSDVKPKEPEKPVEKQPDKEQKKEGSDYQQKVLQQHYYPYGYMPPGYPYNMDPNYGSVPLVSEDKNKEERIKDDQSPSDHSVKAPAPIPNPIQVPNPQKVKTEVNIKEKHQNDNHQILKESIEMKNQMSSYLYSRPQQQQHHNQRDEDLRRFYVYSDQRRKEQQQSEHKAPTPNKAPPPQSPQTKHKEKIEEKKEKEIKQEGVKPTMETQGPPPPPTSQYTYIHPSYMQSPHYGALPFDPNHPVYRGIMVPGPYSGNPYLHPQIPRYHAPEDLSRAPPPTKALDMLQHHAQYYSSHKIHELQERAIKSPTPTKTSVASSSPSANSGQQVGQVQTQPAGPPTSQSSGVPQPGGKQTPGDNKESRSPPPQRHVHTHHHTHVGLGYPMYPAPYGAAVLASQQAAAVTVINPYPPK